MFKAAGTRLVFLPTVILTGFTEISSASLRQDRDPGTFLERGIEMAHAGIQLAEVATNKAEDARVKHFAKIMAGRQKQVLQTLQGLGQNDQVRGVAYDGADRKVITTEQRQTLERLSLLSGQNLIASSSMRSSMNIGEPYGSSNKNAEFPPCIRRNFGARPHPRPARWPMLRAIFFHR